MNAVDISNGALIRVGAEMINSLSEEKKEANICDNRLPFGTDLILRKHPWSCVRKRVELAQLAETPAHGYDYFFELPSDWLRLVSLNNDPDLDYHIEGHKIATDSSTLDLVYCYRPDNYGSLDAEVINVLIHWLAWDIAYALTQSNTLSKRMKEEYDMALREAKSTNAKENPSLVLDTRLWAESSIVPVVPIPLAV